MTNQFFQPTKSPVASWSALFVAAALILTPGLPAKAASEEYKSMIERMKQKLGKTSAPAPVADAGTGQNGTTAAAEVKTLYSDSGSIGENPGRDAAPASAGELDVAPPAVGTPGEPPVAKPAESREPAVKPAPKQDRHAFGFSEFSHFLKKPEPAAPERVTTPRAGEPTTTPPAKRTERIRRPVSPPPVVEPSKPPTGSPAVSAAPERTVAPVPPPAAGTPAAGTPAAGTPAAGIRSLTELSDDELIAFANHRAWSATQVKKHLPKPSPGPVARSSRNKKAPAATPPAKTDAAAKKAADAAKSGKVGKKADGKKGKK